MSKINKATATSCVTEGGKTYTKNDCEPITDLPEQDTVFAWIRQNPLFKG